MYGAYLNIKGGLPAEALEDLTAGVAETFELKGNPRSDLFDIILRTTERVSLIGASILVKILSFDYTLYE